jgi:hypothetical protein
MVDPRTDFATAMQSRKRYKIVRMYQRSYGHHRHRLDP